MLVKIVVFESGFVYHANCNFQFHGEGKLGIKKLESLGYHVALFV